MAKGRQARERRKERGVGREERKRAERGKGPRKNEREGDRAIAGERRRTFCVALV